MSEIQMEKQWIMRLYNNPLTNFPEHSRKLARHRQQLTEMLRRIYPILSFLLQQRALTQIEYDEIHSSSSALHEVIIRLLDWLYKKPQEVFQSFLEALRITKQHYLCQLIEDESFVLNVDHKKVLIHNYPDLQKTMQVTVSLLGHLLQDDVLNQHEVETINSKITELDRTNELLHFLLRTSQDQYQLFMEALRKSNLVVIAEKLQAVDDACNNSTKRQEGNSKTLLISPLEIIVKVPEGLDFQTILKDKQAKMEYKQKIKKLAKTKHNQANMKCKQAQTECEHALKEREQVRTKVDLVEQKKNNLAMNMIILELVKNFKKPIMGGEQAGTASEQAMKEYKQVIKDQQTLTEYEQALTEYEQVTLEYNRAKTKYEQAKTAYEQAQTEHVQTKMEYEQAKMEYKQAKTEYKQAKTEHEQAKTECKQAKMEHEQGKTKHEQEALVQAIMIARELGDKCPRSMYHPLEEQSILS